MRLLIELPHGRSLIQLDEENYFCLDARMVGYGFYEVLYQVLFEKMGNSLSREQGKLLEKLLYQMFQKKKIPYLAGKYLTEGDLPGRDCDMILDGKDKSMFLEIKNARCRSRMRLWTMWKSLKHWEKVCFMRRSKFWLIVLD